MRERVVGDDDEPEDIGCARPQRVAAVTVAVVMPLFVWPPRHAPGQAPARVSRSGNTKSQFLSGALWRSARRHSSAQV